MLTHQLATKTTNLYYNLMIGRNQKAIVRWYKKYNISMPKCCKTISFY